MFENHEMNLSLLVDFYELTMANNFILDEQENVIACFDMFFRKIPDNGGYCIMAGLDQIITFIKNLKFTPEDIKFLESKKFI
ncbi:Nicotinate phosphoribosyltransferase [Candidatus Arthromitus sp. SFB-5]|nr:Nicotinate phosphoribosyltransferase [Candidatus Arthromitus sp. SFB-5]